jgi:hypothetical protein
MLAQGAVFDRAGIELQCEFLAGKICLAFAGFGVSAVKRQKQCRDSGCDCQDRMPNQQRIGR